MKKRKVLDRETAIQKMRKEAKEGIVVVAIICLALVGLAVAFAQSALNRDEELSLGFIERDGVTEVDMSTPAWVASVAYYIFVFVVFCSILALIVYFLYLTKKTGTPFTVKNSRILTALSIMFMLIAVSPFLCLIAYSLVASVTGEHPDSGGGVSGFGITFAPGVLGAAVLYPAIIVFSMFLYVLARIFRYGSFLQEDDEGLI